MTALRVLVVADHFGYPGGVSHGVTTYFLHVLPALVAAGVDVTACFLREAHPAASQLRERGIEPIFLGAGRLNVLVPWQLARIARERGCRVIHASQMKASLAGRMAAHMVGAQAIVHVHDFDPTGPLVRALHRFFARDTDLGIAVAHAVKQSAADNYSLRLDRIRAIHNSVRIEDFTGIAPSTRQSMRDALGLAPDHPTLIMVGRMYAEKGHRKMVRIMARVAARHPNARLLLVGDGPEREACEALTKELRITEHIRFLGQRKDVPQLLAASDLAMLPSDIEGLPLAGIEALAAGKPIVAFDVGGCREVVDEGSTGRLVEPENLEAFADAVNALLADSGLRATLSRNARQAAERFSVEHHVQELVKCYREAEAGEAHGTGKRSGRASHSRVV
jgi:glycosyltransferase involved in cell wall biosynthesis